MSDSVDTAAAREAMIAKRFGGQSDVRTGGKGSVRRKKKTVHKTATNDDKKLNSTLKKLGVNQIPGIEEVNMFKADGDIIHFRNPRVQASIAANTYVVSGVGETKGMQELLPGIIQQLGPDNLASLKQLAEQFAASAGAGAAAAAGAEGEAEEAPELVDFEDASQD